MEDLVAGLDGVLYEGGSFHRGPPVEYIARWKGEVSWGIVTKNMVEYYCNVCQEDVACDVTVETCKMTSIVPPWSILVEVWARCSNCSNVIASGSEDIVLS